MSTQEIRFTEIAEAILEKDGSAEPMRAIDFAKRIRAIPTNGGGFIGEGTTWSAPIKYTITLPAANWVNKEQSVYIAGISDDESTQLIQPVVSSASFYTYAEAQVRVIQSLNQLKFVCETVPVADITLYVVIQTLVMQEQEV